MINGKMKAVTFSYDDGVMQDKRLVELMNKYQLKGTFNLNSELLGKLGVLNFDGKIVEHNKISADEVAQVYRGHEVAVHTLTHPTLRKLDEAEIIRQVEEDRKNLEQIVGYEIVGMAYPNDGFADKRLANIIKQKTKIKYARMVECAESFDAQNDLYRFKPNVHSIMEPEKLFEKAKEFIELKPNKPQMFYVWGHAYEMDQMDRWDMLEEFFALISGKEDIFYGTNAEVLL